MIVALAITEPEIMACHPVMHQLRPHLDAPAFLSAVQRMRLTGYQLVLLKDPDVRCVAGFRIMEMLVSGSVLYVDDLVTCARHRSKSYGQQMLAWLLAEAKQQNCQHLELDSGLQRLEAHRFYETNGLEKVAFHFSIPAKAAKPRSPFLKQTT